MENTSLDFKKQLEHKVKEIETLLDKFLPVAGEAPSMIVEAMNYSVTAGGKRLRPMLI